ncbi:MAG: urease accessory protein UreE [Pseudomonadota bacterium]
MITLTHVHPEPTDRAALPTLTLDSQQRTHSRLRATLDTGEDVGVNLPRGSSLQPQDVLVSDDGVCVRVVAASEPVSVCECSDPLLFARACYHLGNRHVPLQIRSGCLVYSRDHVLDGMLDGLGLQVTHTDAPFEPEAGAYGGGHHHGGHTHAHN